MMFKSEEFYIWAVIEFTEIIREAKSCNLSRYTSLFLTYNGLKRLFIDPIEGFML